MFAQTHADGNLKTENCGLYAAVFVLDWFGVPVDTSQLEHELEVGSHWERPTALLLLKQTFETRKLSIGAYKDATLDDVLAAVDNQRVCLIHVKSTHDVKEGHFYLLVAASNDRV